MLAAGWLSAAIYTDLPNLGGHWASFHKIPDPVPYETQRSIKMAPAMAAFRLSTPAPSPRAGMLTAP